MLNIAPLTPSTLLQNAVEAAKQSGKDYVAVAHSILSKEKISPAEINDFLDHFQWDARLINEVFITKSAPAEFVLTLLKQERFPETLCVSAGKAESDNEAFIVTLIAQAYSFSAPRAKRLTRQFVNCFSPAGIICLLDSTGHNPNISNILNEKLQMAV